MFDRLFNSISILAVSASLFSAAPAFANPNYHCGCHEWTGDTQDGKVTILHCLGIDLQTNQILQDSVSVRGAISAACLSADFAGGKVCNYNVMNLTFVASSGCLGSKP